MCSGSGRQHTLLVALVASLVALLLVHLLLFAYYTRDSLEHSTTSSHSLLVAHSDTSWRPVETHDLSRTGATTQTRAHFPCDPPLVRRARDGVRVDCRELFRGDKEEQRRAFEYMSSRNDQQILNSFNISDWFRHSSSSNNNNSGAECERFLEERRYVRWSSSAEEDAFPLAFSIVMYKDVEQFERLLRAVFRPQNTICVHVDRSSDESIFQTVQRIAQCLNSRGGAHKPNVMVPERERVRVEHSKYSVLEAELVCMLALLNAGRRWKYLINLTGQEFPLRTNLELVRILRGLNGANLVAADPVHNRDRILRPDLVPNGLYIYKGSLHVAVTFEFVQFALSDRRALELLEFLRLYTRVPDEFYFSTLNHNPNVLPAPGSYTGYPHTGRDYPFLVRLKNWGRFPCTSGLVLRGICIWGLDDLPLLALRPELVANKFLAHFQPLALDCLEEWFWNRTKEDHLFGQLDFRVMENMKQMSSNHRLPLYSLFERYTLETPSNFSDFGTRRAPSRINVSFFETLNVAKHHTDFVFSGAP